MGRLIQLILFIFLIVIMVVFYRTYFVKEKNIPIKSIEKEDQLTIKDENNLIKNLRYEVRLDENKQYIITADLSEITYENSIEVVKMQKVEAIFIDETNIPIKITADTANYNNSNYNTNFSENVKIVYTDNIILSDNIDLNFQDNMITIYGNVKYDGLKGELSTDNIKINLITKKIEIYMNSIKDKVEVETK
tara:strand:- start:844 stop:1419 length:576 start_codon:yes stop_codon:yes gene_type:complete